MLSRAETRDDDRAQARPRATLTGPRRVGPRAPPFRYAPACPSAASLPFRGTTAASSSLQVSTAVPCSPSRWTVPLDSGFVAGQQREAPARRCRMAYKPPARKEGLEEGASQDHRIRISLTSKNVKNLEKGACQGQGGRG